MVNRGTQCHQKNKAPQVRGVYITLERQIKHGGTKSRSACFQQAKVHSLECRERFQDIVDNEAAHTAAASASEPNVETPGQAAGGSAPSSSSGPAPAVCGPAPEDVNMGAAESSAAQPTSSAVRTLEAEDDASAKRQKVIAGMPILHETDVDVNVDAHEMVVVAAMPDDRGQWTQRVIDWDNKYHGAKSGNLLDTQKVYEGRFTGGWPPWSWWRGGGGHCCGRTRGSHWVWERDPRTVLTDAASSSPIARP